MYTLTYTLTYTLMYTQVDPHSGRTYYINFATKKTQWNPPAGIAAQPNYNNYNNTPAGGAYVGQPIMQQPQAAPYAQAVQAQPYAQAVPTQQAVLAAKFCTECGNKLSGAQVRFCPQCGKPVLAPAAAAAVAAAAAAAVAVPVNNGYAPNNGQSECVNACACVRAEKINKKYLYLYVCVCMYVYVCVCCCCRGCASEQWLCT